ncbi:hypothetical protein [Treponema sp. OMZ 857]|uniref:hypothetical protein n=1 Tax=Treponema sp. OMZ 857 TaxID=1643513 RepID=UPI0020A4356D|nr:hypothetical protein [Treponema sp. OMZ 857]UTC44709.1 hypothetical protein E4N66_11830 [Treponema sp. OMZ 857]
MAFTFEEWADEHYDSNKPIEPDTENVDPKQWAKIAFYAQDKLCDAFEAGYQSCLNEYGWHFLKDGDTPPQEDKEYLFYFASKGERGMIISDTWERKRNNPYVIAWVEFQTLKD